MFELICVLFNYFFRVDKALEKGNEDELTALWEEGGQLWDRVFNMRANPREKRGLLVWAIMDRISYKKALLHRALCNQEYPMTRYWANYEELCLKGAMYWDVLLREEQERRPIKWEEEVA